MKKFGQFMIIILLLVFNSGILLGIQWLSWHPMEWMTVIIDNKPALSPVFWVIGIVTGLVVTVSVCVLNDMG